MGALREGPQSGPDVRGMMRAGLRCLQRDEVTLARQWFTQAEQTDDPVLLAILGTVYEHRMNEVGCAESCYRRAAQNGLTMAMNNLGVLLTHQDRFGEAMYWLQRAAASGDADALHNLGSVLEHHGYRDDALAYFHQAAQAGHPNAMASVGMHLFLRGDHREAHRWHQRARAAGPHGHRRVRMLAALLAPQRSLFATWRGLTQRCCRR
jgi:TPR repeat protein